MKTITKAMLYSAIVFPGAGYFIIKRKRRGLTALFATLSLLLVLIYEAIYKAKILADAMVQNMLHGGDISLNVLELQLKIEQMSGFFPPWFIQLVTALLICVWLIGLVDTYRLAKRDES